MNVNQYYSHYVVPEKKNKVTVVCEHYSAHHQKVIGVISGGESVCVVNAGLGLHADLRKYVETIVGTDKTIECISLTGRPEDVGASALFDVAYLTPAQQETYLKQGSSKKERMELFANWSENNRESGEYAEKLFIPNDNIPFKEAGDGINQEKPEIGPHMFDKSGDGYAFHLGGTVVQMAELPAQAEGQLVAFSPTCCVAFVGDAIDPVTHLENLDRAGLERYVLLLEKFIEYSIADSPFSEGMAKTPTAYYCSRLSIPMTVETPREILAAAKEVLAGETKHDAPADREGNLRMHYFNNSCVVYDPAKL